MNNIYKVIYRFETQNLLNVIASVEMAFYFSMKLHQKMIKFATHSRHSCLALTLDN